MIEEFTVRPTRSEPYWTDRVIMKVFSRVIPQWVTPNQITIVRFLGTPIVFFLLLQKQYSIALVLFLALAFTDALDGAIARTRNRITPWGIVYDPIADKLLISGAVLILVAHGLGLTLALVIIGFETVILLGGMYFKFVHKTIIPSNIWGKTKMVLQVIATALLLLSVIGNFGAVAHVAFVMYIIASCFAFLSILSHGA